MLEPERTSNATAWPSINGVFRVLCGQLTASFFVVRTCPVRQTCAPHVVILARPVVILARPVVILARPVVILAHARTQGSSPRLRRMVALRCADHHQPELGTRPVSRRDAVGVPCPCPCPCPRLPVLVHALVSVHLLVPVRVQTENENEYVYECGNEYENGGTGNGNGNGNGACAREGVHRRGLDG